MMGYPFRRYIPLLVLLGLLAFLFIVPIRIPFSFRSLGFVHPEKRWRLMTDFDGNYVGEVRNYRLGRAESVVSYRFERGDIASLSLNNLKQTQSWISEGDTIGQIGSIRTEEQLQQKEHLVAIAMRELQASVSAEKAEVIQQLSEQVVLTQQQLNFAETQFGRIEQLYRDSIVPAMTFEEEQTRYLTAKSQHEIAKSNYQSALSGVKPDEARLLEEKMKSLEKELMLIAENTRAYILIAPFDGRLELSPALTETGEYLSISDTSNYVVYAPVKIHFLPYVKADTQFEFYIQGSDSAFSATIYDIGKKAENIGNQQVVFIKAQVDNPGQLQLDGLTAECRFYGERISLREYFSRTIKLYLQ